MATAECYTKHEALLRMGPCVTAQVTCLFVRLCCEFGENLLGSRMSLDTLQQQTQGIVPNLTSFGREGLTHGQEEQCRIQKLVFQTPSWKNGSIAQHLCNRGQINPLNLISLPLKWSNNKTNLLKSLQVINEKIHPQYQEVLNK